MKNTGIVRKFDELGRIVVPKEIRRTFALNEGDSVEIFTQGDMIIFKKYKPGCVCCDECSELVNVNGVMLCDKCISKFYEGIKKYERKLVR